MKKISRREFLKTIGRGLLLGGSTLLISRLVRDDKISFKNCVNNSICKNCSIVKRCDLPQALSYREVVNI